MNRRSLIVGSLVLAAIALLFFRSRQLDSTPRIADTSTNSEETETKLEEVLGRVIPDNAEKVELRDVKGTGGTAIATRVEDEGIVEFGVLADLEDSEEAYQVWVGPNSEELRMLGPLAKAKGGYLFEYRQQGKLDDYKYVELRLGGTKVLEGSF